MTKLTNPQKIVVIGVALIVAFLTLRLLSSPSANTSEGAQEIDRDQLYALVEDGRSNDLDRLMISRSLIHQPSSEACAEAKAVASFYDSCVDVLEQAADGDCNSLIAPPEGSTIPDTLNQAKRYQTSFAEVAASICKAERPRLILIEPVSNSNAQAGIPE